MLKIVIPVDMHRSVHNIFLRTSEVNFTQKAKKATHFGFNEFFWFAAPGLFKLLVPTHLSEFEDAYSPIFYYAGQAGNESETRNYNEV